MLKVIECNDSDEIANINRKILDIPRNIAYQLGISALEIIEKGYFQYNSETRVDMRDAIRSACEKKISIPPSEKLPERIFTYFEDTFIQINNETTLEASFRLVKDNLNPLALNFANGIAPGGGFLKGSRAQEEVLCRSSALYATLKGDQMYAEHRKREMPDSTDWAILSPDTPVFRMDDGVFLNEYWLLSFITCAAPYRYSIGQPKSRELLRKRIQRVLQIAAAYGYSSLVLGAWGCGAFGNDPYLTAMDFKSALENEFRNIFNHVVFAITDWSSDRRFISPFVKAFTT